MRVSMQCGRCGSVAHNERSFDVGKAKHIDQDRTSLNRTWAQDERTFYTERYGRDLARKNQVCVQNRHPERCKTIDDLLTGIRTRPEEMILQIGKVGDDVPTNAFGKCVTDYIGRLQKWADDHGGHMHILGVYFHFDEASPHVHIRRVWDWQDERGYIRIGQEKALKQSGIELPDPAKPEGRYNNRKMSFDVMARELWQVVVQEHGFTIETEPLPRRPHKGKGDFIASQVQSADQTFVDLVDGIRDLTALQEFALDNADTKTLARIDGVIEGLGHVLNDMRAEYGLYQPERQEKAHSDSERDL